MTAIASTPQTDSPLLAPLVGETPAGIDLTYDPEFERLVAEVDKLTSLAAEQPDWRFIDAECSRTLRDKSKDLRVVSWLVAAKANLEGWVGIASGLELYVALSRSFWPSLYPPLKRLRARAGQVEWLWSVLAKRIAALPAFASDAEIVRSLEPRIAELSAFFSENLKDADPGMATLRSALREKIRSLPEPVAEAPPAPQISLEAAAPAANLEAAVMNGPASQGSQATQAAAAKPPPVIAATEIDASSLASLDAAQDAARGLRDSMMTLAHHARQVAPASAWAYRVLRLAAWLAVEHAPEAEGGKTFLRAPKQQERDLLENLRAAGQWDGLLQASEEAAATHIFWLDPQRMSALALEHKGVLFRKAMDTVSRETASFIARIGDIAHLTFSNGSPFATPETVDWLASSSASAATTAPQGAPRADDEATAAVLAELEERLKSGTAGDALARALLATDRLTDARGRFRAHLTIARRAEASDHLDVALLLYERMLPEVTPTLEQWEPGMSAELLGNYLKSLRAFLRNRELPPTEHAKYKEREAQLFKRLLILDPHAALRMRA